MEEATRQSPHSEEAEQALLGSLMLDTERVFDLCTDQEVTDASFYVPAHSTIYGTMAELMVDGKPVDGVTVVDSLKASGKLDGVGGPLPVHRLYDATPTAEHAASYIEILKDKELRREIISAARSAEQEAYESEESAEVIRSKAEFSFADKVATQHEQRTPREIIAKQEEIWKTAREQGCAGIPTGLSVLDTYLGGLIDGALYYVSGPEASCKTTLVRNICEFVAGRLNLPVGIMSLEQTEEQVWGSIAASLAKQSVFHLNSGSKRSNLEAVATAGDIVAKWPIFVDDRPKTITTVWSFARRMVGRHGCRLIVLDYIQAITAERKYGTDEQKITDYSGTMRSIAKTLKVPVLVVSAESRQGKLRGSNMLNYDAWAHVKIKRADAWCAGNLLYDLLFKKQRFGPPIDKEQLRLIGNEQRLVLASTDEIDPPPDVEVAEEQREPWDGMD